MAPSATRSTLEEMLEAMKKQDNEPKDVPPVLPARPTSKARLPSYALLRKKPVAPSAASIPSSPAFVPVPIPVDNGGFENKPKEALADITSVKNVADYQSWNRVASFTGASVSSVGESPRNKLRESKIFNEDLLQNSESKKRKYASDDYREFSSLDSPYDYVDTSPTANKLTKRSHLNSQALKENTRVWCKLSDNKWVHGQLLSVNEDECVVKISNSMTTKSSVEELHPANPDIQEGVEDLLQLSYLNDPAVISNIEQRFKKDMIYSKAGPVLVAVNPFRKFSLYEDSIMNLQKSKAKRSPHVYSVAEDAFTAMLEGGHNQSIIVSGESGSGKTEAAKMTLHYLTAKGDSLLMEKISKANFILEAFGNASTRKNNNSSRFMKITDLHYTDMGRISGAEILACLLDKSRIVKHDKLERSFHIFYQLCAGASPNLREKMKLKTADRYFYLNKGSFLTVDGVDDSNSFHLLVDALNALQISQECQTMAFQLLAAILWLGNISFIDGDKYLGLANNEATRQASSLLGCNIDEFIKALSTRRIHSRGEIILQKLSVLQASEKRDSLAKVLYESLFDWLVRLINQSLYTPNLQEKRSISILDICGFEAFVKNGFEQLLINYANERLRQHCRRHLLEVEQEDYKAEGIDWINFKYEENVHCLEVIEKKHTGLLSLLDEESAIPDRTDVTLSIKLKQQLKKYSSFKGGNGKSFSIQHSSGEVVYETGGFMEKNRGFRHLDLAQLLSSSSSVLVKSVVMNIIKEAEELSSNTLSNEMEVKKPTFVAKFKGQLFKFLWHLENTSPHFIFCVNPNREKLRDCFDSELVLQQLHCWGLMEILHNSRIGYPVRLSYEQFVRRYEFVLSRSIYGDIKHASIAILQRVGISPEMYHIGISKLFLRAGQFDSLESVRLRTLSGIVLVQSAFRSYSLRSDFKKLSHAALLLQAYLRSKKVRSEYLTLRKRNQAAITIQKDYKSKIAKRNYNRTVKLIIQLQAVIRGWLVRRNSNSNNVVCLQEKEKFSTDQQDFHVDSQRNISREESRLREKEDEIAVLRQRLQQYESRWLDYESKMKSMEEMWQKQISSLQVSLAAAKKRSFPEANGLHVNDDNVNPGFSSLRASSERHNLQSENSDFDWEEATSMGIKTPDNNFALKRPSRISDAALGKDTDSGRSAVVSLAREFEERTNVFNDDVNFLVEVQSGHAEANLNPEQELRNLHTRFEVWKKSFRSRLRETRCSLQKLRKKDTKKKTKKKWWAILGFS